MAWKAKLKGLIAIPSPTLDEMSYQVTVEYFDGESAYTKTKIVPYSVTKAQVLNAIKGELVDLNAGAGLLNLVASHIDEEIDATTTW